MQKLRIAIWAGGIITVLVYLGFSIAWFALGTPSLGQTWQDHFFGSTQAKANHLDFPIPAFGMAIDVCILVIPLIGVYYLQLSKRRRIALVLVFLTAALYVLELSCQSNIVTQPQRLARLWPLHFGLFTPSQLLVVLPRT